MVPDPKGNAAPDDRLAMLKELAKLTKPTGPSAQGKAIDKPEEEEAQTAPAPRGGTWVAGLAAFAAAMLGGLWVAGRGRRRGSRRPQSLARRSCQVRTCPRWSSSDRSSNCT